MALPSALVVVLWPTRWRWPALAIGAVVVLAVGVSRLYLGVHYPSDVLTAWMLALGWVAGLRLILARRGGGAPARDRGAETRPRDAIPR